MHADTGKDMIQWMEEVMTLTREAGYVDEFVFMFLGDIRDCFYDGKTPHECFEEVF